MLSKSWIIGFAISVFQLWLYSQAQDVTLVWDPNSETDLVGYNVYRSQSSGSGFTLINTSLVPVDPNPTFTDTSDKTGLSTVFYVVSAVNTTGLESNFSNEVTLTFDTTAPSVSLTSPAGGSTVSGTVTVSASASDDVPVASVEFFVNGASLGVDTSAPYSVPWVTTSLGDGSHTLTAQAIDTSGNSSISAPVSVTVDNASPPDTTAPSVLLASPAGGSTVSGIVSVSAFAFGNVASVEFFVNGASLGMDTWGPYSVPWNTKSLYDGTHTLTAQARDPSGNSSTSAPVSVTIDNTRDPVNNPPTVSAGPAQTVDSESSVTLSGSATDPEGDSLTYSWEQVSGPSVGTITDASKLQASFTAPTVTVDTDLLFRLTVGDGTNAEVAATVEVTLLHLYNPPVFPFSLDTGHL